MIVVQPENGLANRLRVIASFSALARRTGRPLQVSWAPSAGWSDEDLEDLFVHDLTRTTPDDFVRLASEGLRLHDVVELRREPFESQTWLGDVRFQDLFDRERHPVITYRGCQPVGRLAPRADLDRLFPSYRAEYVRAARELRPTPEIQQSIERLVDSFGDHTVGVHIRRGDAVTSRSLAHRFLRSSDLAFMQAMDRELKADPDVVFFLATDSEETEYRFKEIYGSAIRTNPDKEFVMSRIRHPKANQRDAVIDMYCLARTQRILGNNFSSFSKFAATIGGITWQAVLEEDEEDEHGSSFFVTRSGRACDTVASFAVNGVGLGHASRLVAVHDELRREGALVSSFFVRHDMEIIREYGFGQTLLPRYKWYLMELTGPNESTDPAHDVAKTIVEMTLRGRQPLVLHDVFIHRAVYEVAVESGWPQALIYRDRKGIEGPGPWLRTVAPAVEVAFWIGRPGYEEQSPDLQVIGVEDVVRRPLGQASMWDEVADDELRVVVTGGGGGHRGCDEFLNAAVAAVDLLSRRTDRRVRCRVVTGPYFKGQTRFPIGTPAEMTLTSYVPPKYSLYADASVVVAQAGYNTVQELAACGVPHVLVPLDSRVGYDDQEERAEGRRGSDGVYVADDDPEDIRAGIEAVLAAPSRVAVEVPRQAGASQIATLLEVLSGI